jgi:hypothetical protein
MNKSQKLDEENLQSIDIEVTSDKTQGSDDKNDGEGDVGEP